MDLFTPPFALDDAVVCGAVLFRWRRGRRGDEQQQDGQHVGDRAGKDQQQARQQRPDAGEQGAEQGMPALQHADHAAQQVAALATDEYHAGDGGNEQPGQGQLPACLPGDAPHQEQFQDGKGE